MRSIDRLKAQRQHRGNLRAPISDIGMIFLNDVEPMNWTRTCARRHGAWQSISKLIIDRLLSGYGVAIDTLQTPDYIAYDPSITVRLTIPEKAKELLAASGYGPDNPVKFKIQTTRGFKPKDYEIIQAIVGLWRKVGIEAEIEVYEIAKHFELRAADTAGSCGLLQLGQRGRRSDHIDRVCHVRPVAALRLGR